MILVLRENILGNCYSFALDISISMNKSFQELIPSKLDVAKEALAAAVSRLARKGAYIGLVFFAGRAFPVLNLTNNYNIFYTILSRRIRTFEASAPGDAIIEASKLFWGTRCKERKIIMITDGDYNEGVPPEAAVLYPINNKYNIYLIILNIKGHDKIGELLNKYNNIKIYYTKSRNEVLSAILSIIGET